MYGTTYRFQEEDAADGNSFEPSDPGRSTRQFPSSEKSQGTINAGTKMQKHDQKRKTLPQNYRHHLYVPCPSNRRRSMLATTSIRWGILKSLAGWPFSERGERTSNHASQHLLADWWWIRSWRARPNYRTHWKLSAADTVLNRRRSKNG